MTGLQLERVRVLARTRELLVGDVDWQTWEAELAELESAAIEYMKGEPPC